MTAATREQHANPWSSFPVRLVLQFHKSLWSNVTLTEDGKRGETSGPLLSSYSSGFLISARQKGGTFHRFPPSLIRDS